LCPRSQIRYKFRRQKFVLVTTKVAVDPLNVGLVLRNWTPDVGVKRHWLSVADCRCTSLDALRVDLSVLSCIEYNRARKGGHSAASSGSADPEGNVNCAGECAPIGHDGNRASVTLIGRELSRSWRELQLPEPIYTFTVVVRWYRA